MPTHDNTLIIRPKLKCLEHQLFVCSIIFFIICISIVFIDYLINNNIKLEKRSINIQKKLKLFYFFFNFLYKILFMYIE
jgi:hypothetical protein